MKWLGLLGLGLLGAYLATGLRVIQPDEVGVVRHLGAARRTPWPPGLHLGLPWPLERVDRVKPGQTRTLAFGVRDDQESPLRRVPNPLEDDILTGDLNLVTVQATLQYRVSDPVAFLFAAARLEPTLKAISEAALARAIGRRGVDEILTSGRREMALEVAAAIDQHARRDGLGIAVRSVELGRVAPPVPVADAFADAARARSDRRQAVTAAEEYRDRVGSESRGQAREILDRAAARADRLQQLARGEADRFTRVLAEARLDPDATRQRLYLETLALLLPRFQRKVVVQPGQDVDLGLFTEPAGETAPPSPEATTNPDLETPR